MDEFAYHYTASEKPHIQNDTITSEPGFLGLRLPVRLRLHPTKAAAFPTLIFHTCL